ncbi:amidohydrolase [Aestuariibius sp. HNIBRBA575]|uniref:amidohydrolase n=1 Tax=Aestuariibius sp. HNIBRBA575 TaxID=3233343 RepID=UPI0034A32804
MTDLSDAQLRYLTALRHDLHRRPEISGQETQTANRIALELRQIGADRIWQNLGGHGVAAEFKGQNPGPTILFRAELDGLPIQEISELSYRSEVGGKGHLCGHDGHMCMVLGLGMTLQKRPKSGRVILLFQPAEETGFGAQAVIDDPRWGQICPDYAFAFHNVPGRPIGEIGLRNGVANCASRGMKIRLQGKSSHAAAPEDGVSPATAMAQLMQQLPALGQGNIKDADFALSTLTHVQLGEPTFGIAPGQGEIRVTLRSRTDEMMQEMSSRALNLLNEAQTGLRSDVDWCDVFYAVNNHSEGCDIARKAAASLGYSIFEMPHPMRWSEDFGRFENAGACTNLMFMGSGETQPQLHNPDFDFPDALLPIGIDLYERIVAQVL